MGTVKLGFKIAIGKTSISDAAVNQIEIKFSFVLLLRFCLFQSMYF